MPRYLNRREALAGRRNREPGRPACRLRRGRREPRAGGCRNADRRRNDDAGRRDSRRTSRTLPPAPSRRSRPRARTTSTSTRSAATSGRTRDGEANLRLGHPGARRRGLRPDTATRSWTSGTATRIGSYSGFNEEGTFLRGAQVTNSEGIVQFTTIYPGWYMGRTVHIHAKVPHRQHDGADHAALLRRGRHRDGLRAGALLVPKRERDTFNDGDGIYDDQLVLTLRATATPTAAAINFDVQSA